MKGLESGKLHHCQTAKNVINLHTSFQSSPIMSRMLITRLIWIRQKSPLFLSPVSTVSARNAWEHGALIGAHRQRKVKKEMPAFLESRSAKASSTNKLKYTHGTLQKHNNLLQNWKEAIWPLTKKKKTRQQGRKADRIITLDGRNDKKVQYYNLNPRKRHTNKLTAETTKRLKKKNLPTLRKYSSSVVQFNNS